MASSSVCRIQIAVSLSAEMIHAVFWGAAIVLFLSKIINLHNPDTQGFWIEISSQVETGKPHINS